MPYFFLSYARDDADGYLDRFYKDLCEAVRAKTGLKLADVGFRDQTNMDVGDDWLASLGQAIASARVFVALCSPSYFASDMCGKEWQLFIDLARARGTGSTVQPSNLLPTTWFPTRQLPAAAERLQYSQQDLGEIYEKEGLNYLCRFTRYEDDYWNFVLRFADRIVAVGGTDPLPAPPSPPDLGATTNAFVVDRPVPPPPAGSGSETDPGKPSTTSSATSTTGPHGPHHVTFVIVAAPLSEIQAIRGLTHFYDANPFRWAPYWSPNQPESSERICISAQRVAVGKDMTSELTHALADTSIVDLLNTARERNQILALIVDVWTTRIDAYRSVLLAYDADDTSTSPVLVPWSDADVELSAVSDDQQAHLRTTLPLISERQDSLFRSKIPTIHEFRTDLNTALDTAQSRIFQFGRVVRQTGDDPPTERPFLA